MPAVFAKRNFRRICYAPSLLSEGAGWKVVLRHVQHQWKCPKFAKYVRKDHVKEKRLRVSGGEVQTVLHTSAYAGLGSSNLPGSPPSQNLAEGLVNALKVVARTYKHHISVVGYMKANAKTLRSWAKTPGNVHSVCGPGQIQSMFPLPVGRDDVSPDLVTGAGRPIKSLGVLRWLAPADEILAVQDTSGCAIVEILPHIFVMRKWAPAAPVHHVHAVLLRKTLEAKSTDEVEKIWESPECGIIRKLAEPTSGRKKGRDQDDLLSERFEYKKWDELFENNTVLTCQGKYAFRPKCGCTLWPHESVCNHMVALMEHLGICRYTPGPLPIGTAGRGGRPRRGAAAPSHPYQTQRDGDEAADRLGAKRAAARHDGGAEASVDDPVAPETPGVFASRLPPPRRTS